MKQEIFGCKVVPIATSKRRGTKEIVLIVSYRVPLQNFVVEFPAGLKGPESIEECGERELKVPQRVECVGGDWLCGNYSKRF